MFGAFFERGWVTPSSAQTFLLILCLGITSGRLEDHMRCWAQTKVNCMQGYHPIRCAIYSAPNLMFICKYIDMIDPERCDFSKHFFVQCEFTDYNY